MQYTFSSSLSLLIKRLIYCIHRLVTRLRLDRSKVTNRIHHHFFMKTQSILQYLLLTLEQGPILFPNLWWFPPYFLLLNHICVREASACCRGHAARPASASLQLSVLIVMFTLTRLQPLNLKWALTAAVVSNTSSTYIFLKMIIKKDRRKWHFQIVQVYFSTSSGKNKNRIIAKSKL